MYRCSLEKQWAEEEKVKEGSDGGAIIFVTQSRIYTFLIT